MALQRPVRRLRPLPAAVAVIVIAVIVGMVSMWPPATTGQEVASQTLQPATVRSVELLDESAARVGLRLEAGPEAGREVTLETQLEGLPGLSVGDRVRVAGSDDTGWWIADFVRTTGMWLLAGLFVLVVLAVGRWHGLRSLLGLAASLVVVVRFVVPAILAGSSPPLVALVGAVAVMVLTLYLSHGVSTKTTTAVVGTTIALVITIALAMVFIDLTSITGFASEEANFARVAVPGLDLRGLVLAGLIIATLGVLDDVTVTQASTVYALHDTDPSQTPTGLFRSAMTVGRDHIASTVNTLFLAYAGASLALLVLFSTGGQALADIVSSEIVAAEIVKTLVGSLGLVSAVPITTLLAATMAVRRHPQEVAANRRARDLDPTPIAHKH